MTTVRVYLDDAVDPVFSGTASFTRNRGNVTTTFAYDTAYLARPGTLPIDPAFPLFSGNQYHARLPGAFSDSAPDRWGRNLLQRSERLEARRDGRSPRTLDDIDFLLGVNDETRQGALRYRLPDDDVFRSPHATVPRLVALPQLLRASDEVAADEDGTQAYKILLDAGTASLGGARPKASVRFDDGSLGLAKFPHREDDGDLMAWEDTALEIAGRAGMRIPWRRLVSVGSRHVLLLRRFDREPSTNRRIGYMSAMTLLEETDGAAGDYVGLSARLEDFSAQLRADRRELFDRVVLSVALHNTDDHLRNHGVLRVRNGWELSPLFDVNPNPDPTAPRSTAIAGAVDPADEWDGLLALADESGIAVREAAERIQAVADAAATWRTIATENDIPQREQQRMAESIAPRIEMLAARSSALRSTPATRDARRTRAKTSPQSTSGSFAPHRRTPPSGALSERGTE